MPQPSPGQPPQPSPGQPSVYPTQKNKRLIKPLSALLTIALIEGSSAILALPLWASPPPATVMQGQARISFKDPDDQQVRKITSNETGVRRAAIEEGLAESRTSQATSTNTRFNQISDPQIRQIQLATDHGHQRQTK